MKTSDFFRKITIILLIIILSGSQKIYGQDVKVNINWSEKSSWKISPYIFGRFFELNGRDSYPGFVSQHIANGSFEQWNEFNNRHIRDEIIFREVEPVGNVAYPWQSVSDGRVWFSLVANGVHGTYFQRIKNPEANSVSLYQKTALPDERIQTYDISFYAKANENDISLIVSLKLTENSKQSNTKLQLSDQWEKYKVSITIPEITTERFQNSPFGIYNLAFEFNQKAIIDLDHVILSAGDAINGKFNPTTVKWIKDFNVTTLRWPGGNYASMYRWTDAVGPIDERPVSNNDEWGGLEPNYFGTNEFLEFCRLTNIEPYINVPFNLEIAPPGYIADWVEYVNGDTTTAMGKLRKKHGYPDPWHVKYWQVGNEHYGTYQAGFVFAEEYAENIKDYLIAMKNADSSITVFVSGADPLYTDHEGDQWNETLLDITGEQIDGIDIHRYVNQVTVNREEYESLDPYLRAHLYVAFPTQYEKIMDELINDAKNRDLSDLYLTIGEWNLSGVKVDEEKLIDYPTMPHAAFVAGMYQAFIKKGKWVKFTHQRDNTLYFRPYFKDFRPVNPGAYVLEAFAEPFTTDENFHLLETLIQSPAFDHPKLGERMMAMENVPYVDGVMVINDNDTKAYLFLTNRNLRENYDVAINMAGDQEQVNQVIMKEIFADPVFKVQKSWNENQFEIKNRQIKKEGAMINFTIKPASVIRLEMDLSKKS